MTPEEPQLGEWAPQQLSIAKILKQWDADPFVQHVWEIETPITREEVGAAIFDQSCETAAEPVAADADRETHIRRVAYLAVHGWEDPIEVDLGIPSMNFLPDWPIQDGNHRLAAAIFRGDRSIMAEVSGESAWIKKFVVSGSNP